MRLAMRTIGKISAVLWLLGATAGCKLIDQIMAEPSSEVKTTPEAKAQLFAAAVADGSIRTRSTSKSAWLQEARDQLAYASGQLRELGGLMDPDRVEVDLDLAHIKADGEVSVVPFKARFPVSWSADIAAPPALTLYLPKGGDKEARQAFFTAYGATCADPAAAELALRVFWFHYRPQRSGCAIGQGTFDHSLVARSTLLLTARVK